MGVIWIWMQRKAIDNSTFSNESEIGHTVQGWIDNYNRTHRAEGYRDLTDRSHDIAQIAVKVKIFISSEPFYNIPPSRYLKCDYKCVQM
jgi:hypothetical protein